MKLTKLFFLASLISSSQAFSAAVPALVKADAGLVKKLTGTFKVESCEGTYSTLSMPKGGSQPLVPGTTSIIKAYADGLQITRVWTDEELLYFSKDTLSTPQLDEAVEEVADGNNFRVISTFDNANQAFAHYVYFTYEAMSSQEELVNSVKPNILTIKATEQGLIVTNGAGSWAATECLLSRQ